MCESEPPNIPCMILYDRFLLTTHVRNDDTEQSTRLCSCDKHCHYLYYLLLSTAIFEESSRSFGIKTIVAVAAVLRVDSESTQFTIINSEYTQFQII